MTKIKSNDAINAIDAYDKNYAIAAIDTAYSIGNYANYTTNT